MTEAVEEKGAAAASAKGQRRYCVHSFSVDPADGRWKVTVAKASALPRGVRKVSGPPRPDIWAWSAKKRRGTGPGPSRWVKIHRAGTECPAGWRPLTVRTLEEFGG